ncbi:hypothetical protein LXL04_039684 [Taraxacum kok-saghyz]
MYKLVKKILKLGISSTDLVELKEVKINPKPSYHTDRLQFHSDRIVFSDARLLCTHASNGAIFNGTPFSARLQLKIDLNTSMVQLKIDLQMARPSPIFKWHALLCTPSTLFVDLKHNPSSPLLPHHQTTTIASLYPNSSSKIVLCPSGVLGVAVFGVVLTILPLFGAFCLWLLLFFPAPAAAVLRFWFLLSMAGSLLWGPACEMRSALFPGLCSLTLQAEFRDWAIIIMANIGNFLFWVKLKSDYWKIGPVEKEPDTEICANMLDALNECLEICGQVLDENQERSIVDEIKQVITRADLCKWRLQSSGGSLVFWRVLKAFRCCGFGWGYIKCRVPPLCSFPASVISNAADDKPVIGGLAGKELKIRCDWRWSKAISGEAKAISGDCSSSGEAKAIVLPPARVPLSSPAYTSCVPLRRFPTNAVALLRLPEIKSGNLDLVTLINDQGKQLFNSCFGYTSLKDCYYVGNEGQICTCGNPVEGDARSSDR